MNIEQLEARFKALEKENKDLQKKVVTFEEENKALQKKVTTLEDIEAIKKIQRAYGFYLEHMMADEVADLWAEDGELQWSGLGVFKGRETIRKCWTLLKEWASHQGRPELQLHITMMTSPYITVSTDGNKAWGRWYVRGGSAGGQGLYENEYVKENGIWKIKIISIGGFGLTLPGQENMDPAQIERDIQTHMSGYPFSERWSRSPRQEASNWIRPFHFKHPVTGKDVNRKVEAWNKAHPDPLPPGGDNWLTRPQLDAPPLERH